MMQEIQPNRDETEDDRHWRVDDINIPLVAVSVAFFGVLLSVTIISLQAWFYDARAREIAAKTAPQEARGTELGDMLYVQRAQLNDPAGFIKIPAAASASASTTSVAATSATSTTSQPAPRYHVPIEAAMQMVSRQYAEGSR